MIAIAKANPKKLTYATQGVGSTAFLTAKLFEARTGIELTHVPYRGAGPALNDLVAGHVDMMFDTIVTSLPLHRVRQSKDHRRRRRQALAGVAGYAHNLRNRGARIPIDLLVCGCRAPWHATGDRR